MEVYTDLEKTTDMKRLHGWWFTYNSLTETWCATTAEYRDDVYNNYLSPNVIKSNSFETLRELIIRTDGNINEMNILTYGNSNSTDNPLSPLNDVGGDDIQLDKEDN